MGRRRTWSALAFTAVTLGLGGAARATDRDVAVPTLPEEALRIQATPDGGAWLIGGEQGADLATGLWRFEADDRPARPVAIPGDRKPVAIAWSQEDRALWLAGYDWVAVLAEDGTFRVLPLDSRRLTDLAVTAPGHATLTRSVPNRADGGGFWSAEVVRLHRRGDELSFTTERFTGEVVNLGSLVPDGRGGFWTFMYASWNYGRKTTGYLHRGEVGWRAWMPGGVWPDFVEPPSDLIVAGATPPELGQDFGGRFFVTDGTGGFYFQTALRDGFFRVGAGGHARLIDANTLPSAGITMFWNDVAFDKSRDALLFLTGGSRSRDFDDRVSREPVRFSIFDGQRVGSEERLPFPSWGRAEWVRGGVAVAGGVWWAAYPGLVLRHADDGWVRFSSQRMKDRLGGERRERAREIFTEIAGGLLGAALVLLSGTFLASRVGGERPLIAGLQIAATSLIAAAPALLALAMNPLVHGGDLYGIRIFLCTIGVAVEIVLCAAGAFSMGKTLGARPRGAGALPGAIIGAAAGAVVGLLLDGQLYNLLHPIDLDVQAFRWTLAIGLGGVCGTIGYQVAGGRPAPRA